MPHTSLMPYGQRPPCVCSATVRECPACRAYRLGTGSHAQHRPHAYPSQTLPSLSTDTLRARQATAQALLAELTDCCLEAQGHRAAHERGTPTYAEQQRTVRILLGRLKHVRHQLAIYARQLAAREE